MKKILIYIVSVFFFLLLPFIINAQNKITDYQIGVKLQGEDMVSMEVGGLDGMLFLYANKKGLIKSIGFVPSKDGGRSPAKVYKGEFIRFKQFIESQYEVGFEREIDLQQKKQHYTASYNGSKIVITIDELEDDLKPMSMTYMMNKI